MQEWTKKSTRVAVVLASLFVVMFFGAIATQLSAAPQKPADRLQVLTVQGYIDGRDWLYISPNRLYWHHLDYAAVGRWGGVDEPTKLFMKYTNKLNQRVAWSPDWKCPYWDCYSYETNSSPYYFGLPLPEHYALTNIQVLQARESITVQQYPSADNGYVTIIDFNDDYWGGADWYAVQLTFRRLE